MPRVYGFPTRPYKINYGVTAELLEQVNILAAMDKISPNYKSYLIVKEYVDKHQAQIQQYKKFMEQLTADEETPSVSRQSIRVHSTTEEE